jgi:hypothetical protein
MTGVKFIAVLLVVSLVLTAFMVAPKAAGQEAQYTKRIFGLVGMPSAETIAFCKANGWGIELSLPGSNFRTYFNGDPDTDSYIKIIQSIIGQGIPVWLEIEAPIYYDGDISAATTPAQYQSMYGAGLAKYEQLGPLFKGYAFEGGYDNAIIWLKEHSTKQLVAHWLSGYYGAYNGGAPDYKPTVVPAWGTHDMAWRVNQVDEIMWEVYQVEWAQLAPSFKAWLDTVAPGKPFGVLSGWEPNGGYWWNQYGHNYYDGAKLYTGEQEKALLTQWLNWLKEQIGPFSGIVVDPWNPLDQLTISNQCSYVDSLSTTNGTPTPTPSATPTPTATPTPLVVTAVDPTKNATNVSVNTTLTATFNQKIQAGANYSTIALSNGTPVPVTTSIAGTTLTITPYTKLSYNTAYTLTIPRDAVKNGTTTLTTPSTSTFTTVKRAR